MSTFTDSLTVTKIDARRWRVEREFTYYIGEENSNEFVTVPKGFETDFASVPRLFWSILPPDGTYTQAAVLHDFLYSVQLYTRKRSDEIFLEAMAVLRVWVVRRLIMFSQVRLWGFIPWNKKRKVG